MIMLALLGELLKKPKYETIKYCFDTKNSDLLRLLINCGEFMQQDWSDDFVDVLSYKEYFTFVSIASHFVDIEIPQSLVDKVFNTMSQNQEVTFQLLIEDSDFRQFLFDSITSESELVLNDAFVDFIYSFDIDFIKGLFRLPNVGNNLAKSDFLSNLEIYYRDCNLYELLPHELLPCIAYLDNYHDNMVAFDDTISQWMPGLSLKEKDLLSKLHSKINSKGFDIKADDLCSFLRQMELTQSIGNEVLAISSKYFKDDYVLGFRLINKYLDRKKLREDLLLNGNITESLVMKLLALSMMPKNENINSYADILNMDIDALLSEAKNSFEDVVKQETGELRNPNGAYSVKPFFTYNCEVAIIDREGNFDFEKVEEHHKDSAKTMYRKYRPEGKETEEFEQYKEMARNGIIVFCISNTDVLVLVPQILSTVQKETLKEKITAAPDGFNIFANTYAEDFSMELLGGNGMNKDVFLLLVELFCECQDFVSSGKIDLR